MNILRYYSDKIDVLKSLSLRPYNIVICIIFFEFPYYILQLNMVDLPTLPKALTVLLLGNMRADIIEIT